MGSKIVSPICDPNWKKARIIFFDNEGEIYKPIGSPAQIKEIWDDLDRAGHTNRVLCVQRYPSERGKPTKSQKELLTANKREWEKKRKETQKQFRAQKAAP
jgi:hypothetical protein